MCLTLLLHAEFPYSVFCFFLLFLKFSLHLYQMCRGFWVELAIVWGRSILQACLRSFAHGFICNVFLCKCPLQHLFLTAACFLLIFSPNSWQRNPEWLSGEFVHPWVRQSVCQADPAHHYGWIDPTGEVMSVYTNVVLFEICVCEQEGTVGWASRYTVKVRQIENCTWVWAAKKKQKKKTRHYISGVFIRAAKISIWFRFGEFACFGYDAKHVVTGREQSWRWVDWFGNGT